MAQKKLSNEEIIIELLQKNLIVTLYKEGFTRNEIAKLLSLNVNTVQAIIKILKKSRGRKNE